MAGNIVTLTQDAITGDIKSVRSMAERLRKALDNVKNDLPANEVKPMQEKMKKLARKCDDVEANLIENKQEYIREISLAPLMGTETGREFVKQTSYICMSSSRDSHGKLLKEYDKLQKEYGKLKNNSLKGRKTTTKKSSVRKTTRKTVRR